MIHEYRTHGLVPTSGTKGADAVPTCLTSRMSIVTSPPITIYDSGAHICTRQNGQTHVLVKISNWMGGFHTIWWNCSTEACLLTPKECLWIRWTFGI
uniref:Uncharacterized protein n=1 Tax=Arundo donax TaxID=35708 RepID=A0A0A9G1T5_ARUDO